MIAARLAGVTKRFGPLTALDQVELDVEQGDVLALLGPNGAGKSTALSLLLGLRVPDIGHIELNGLDPRRAEARRAVGVTPQEVEFPTTLKVAELIGFVACHYPRPLPLDVVCARFDLGPLLQRQLGGLSGGERRKVAVALAFAGGPGLVILDEPTAGLDVSARRIVWEAIRAHAQEGGTVLLTTHHLDEAEALAHTVVLLNGGRVVQRGTVSEIKRAAGLARISFRAPSWFAFDGAERDGDIVRIAVRDAGTLVERLVHQGVHLADLEVRPLTLEEALAVTEEHA